MLLANSESSHKKEFDANGTREKVVISNKNPNTAFDSQENNI